MRFKKWLLMEEDGDGGSDGGSGPSGPGSSWDLLYPTTAADYTWANSNPVEHFWFQWKLRRGEKIGRPLYNLDNEEFQRRRYTTIESPNAPDGDAEWWTHREDDGQSSTKVVDNVNLVWIGDGKTSKDAHPIDGYNFCCTPFGGHTLWQDYSKDPDEKLERTFGDKISGNFPDIGDPKKFDQPFLHTEGFKQWLSQREHVGLGGAGDFGQGASLGTAMHGGTFGGNHLNQQIRSKYTSNNARQEPSDTDVDALFGIKKPKDKRSTRERRAKTIHKKRQATPGRVPRPNM